jgi:thiol-disulfide isomerase/thioredoxin
LIVGYRSVLVVAALTVVAAVAPAGEKRPALTAKALDGAPFSLAALRGKVVLVNFWASWCVPCRVEMPALDAYYRRHRGDGFAMLAIAMDAGGPVRKLRQVSGGFAFPVARIDDVRMPRDLIPTALPKSQVYDRNGTLRYESAAAQSAPLDQAALERIVTPLLKERGPVSD